MIRVYRDKREVAPLDGGEANVGANVGASGIGAYDGKTGSTLNFRKAYGTNGVKTSLNGQEVDHELDVHGVTTAESPTVTQDYIAFSDESAAGDPTKRQIIQVIWNLGLATYLTSQGHMLHMGAVSTPVGLAIGTPGQLLVTNAGATAPEWATAKRTIQLLAPAGKATTTSGCGDLTSVETTTHKVNFDVLPFDKDSDEYAYWPAFLLTNWNAGVVNFRVFWTATAGSGTVAWALQGLACSDGDDDDAAWGTAVVVSDTLIGTGKTHITAWSDDLTIGGTPAAGDEVKLQLYRDVSADTLSDDALLRGVEILYTTSSYTDG